MMERPAEGLVITGHLDGFAIRFGGEVVEIYPTLKGAEDGRRAARAALEQLMLTFLKKDA